jgi:hypothetical protein
MNTLKIVFISFPFVFSGCAHFDFDKYSDNSKPGIVYFNPKPYFLLSIDAKCSSVGTVVMMPDEKMVIRPVSGIGNSDLSVKFSQGFITELGQKNDTQTPTTIAAITDLAVKAAALSATLFSNNIPLSNEKETKASQENTVCTPKSFLYPFENGIPDKSKRIEFKI